MGALLARKRVSPGLQILWRIRIASLEKILIQFKENPLISAWG